MEKPIPSQESKENSKEINISLVVCSYSKTDGLLVLVDSNEENKLITLHTKDILDTKTLSSTLEKNNQTKIEPSIFSRKAILTDSNPSKDFVYISSMNPESIDHYCEDYPSLKFVPIDKAIDEAGDDVSREAFIRVKEGEDKYLLDENYYDYKFQEE